MTDSDKKEAAIIKEARRRCRPLEKKIDALSRNVLALSVLLARAEEDILELKRANSALMSNR